MFFCTKILFLVCSLTVVLALPADEVPTLGGVKKLTGEELKTAENELKSSLTKLAAGEGPSYEVDKVNSATTQTVAGTLTKLNVDLVNSKGEKKNCDVSIWSRTWLENGIEVTFECEGEDKVVKKHSA